MRDSGGSQKTVLVFIIVLFALLYVFIFLFQRKPLPPHSITPVLCIFGVFVYLVSALIFFVHSLDKLCVKLGYVCPHCHKPLYKLTSWDYHVEVTGRCPSCKERLTDRAIERSHDSRVFVVAPGTFMDGLPKRKLPAFFLACFGIFALGLLVIHNIPRDFLIEHPVLFQAIMLFAVTVLLAVVVSVLRTHSR